MSNNKGYWKKKYNKLKKDPEEYRKFREKANERNRKYYSKPDVKKRKKIYKKQYDVKNKSKIKKYGAELRTRPKYQARVKQWREDNKEHLRDEAKKYREKNRERLNKWDREYSKNRRKDPEFIKQERLRCKKFREENPEVVKKYNQKYYTSPKGFLASTRANHKRMTLRHKCKFKLTRKQIKQIYDRDKVCVYCGKKYDLELDHIIALANGGEGIFENFVVACRSCNSSKNAHDVSKWCKQQGIKVPKIVIENLKKMKDKSILKTIKS